MTSKQECDLDGLEALIARATAGEWIAHGFTYPEGVKGDVFAKDSGNVLACTPICRVVEPVSKMDSDLRRPPLDALQAIARKNATRPVIEANATLIVAAINSLPSLISRVRSAEEERDGLREALNNISRRYSNGADASTLAWLARKALSTGNQEGGA